MLTILHWSPHILLKPYSFTNTHRCRKMYTWTHIYLIQKMQYYSNTRVSVFVKVQCSVKLHHHKNCEYILLASSYCIYVCFYLSLKLTFVIAWCYHFQYNFLALFYGYLRIWIFFPFFFLYWKTLFSKQIWFKTVGFLGGRCCNNVTPLNAVTGAVHESDQSH